MAAEEDGSMDHFIKKRLKGFKLTSKGMITGYIETKQNYDNFIRDLKVYGCTYSVRSCSMGKPEKGFLQFRTFSNDLQIPFTGSPFHIEGTTYYVCTQGIRYYKCKGLPAATGDVVEDEEENEAPQRKRRKCNRSIKVGCPAKMTVKTVRLYPDYKTLHDSWRRKNDVLKRLKVALKATPPPRSVVHYWVALSPEEIHTHKRTTTQKIQLLHPDLITEIHRIVGTGITSIPVIKTRLQDFVDSMFSKSVVKPDPSNTAFFPSDKSIYNHAHDAKMGLKPRGPEEPNEPDESSLSETEASLPDSESLSETNTSSSFPVENIEDSSEEIASEMEVQEVESEMEVQKIASEMTVEKIAPEMTVDNLDTPFWPDQAVLPGNIVQVVNSHGTIMFMVTQPISDHISNDQIDGGIAVAPPNLVNVNLEDSIYAVSVSDSSGRILGLSDELILQQNCGDLTDGSEINSATVSTKSSTLISEKVIPSDMNRVITVEGNVVLDVRQSSLAGSTDNNVSPSDEQANQFILKNHLPVHLTLQQANDIEIQKPNEVSQSAMEEKTCVQVESIPESIIELDLPVIQQSVKFQPQPAQTVQEPLIQQIQQPVQPGSLENVQQEAQGPLQDALALHEGQPYHDVQYVSIHRPNIEDKEPDSELLLLDQSVVGESTKSTTIKDTHNFDTGSEAQMDESDEEMTFPIIDGHNYHKGSKSRMNESSTEDPELIATLSAHNYHKDPKTDMDVTPEKVTEIITTLDTHNYHRGSQARKIQAKKLTGALKPSRQRVPLRERLRVCAQDIINLSYACTNHKLTEEVLSVLQKYRKLLLTDVAQKGESNSGESEDDV